MIQIPKIICLSVIGAITYQSLIDLRLQFLDHNRIFLNDQLHEHEKFKENELKKSPNNNANIEYFKLGGSYERNDLLYYNGKDLTIENSKKEIILLEKKIDNLKYISLFPYLREPYRITNIIYSIKKYIFKSE